MSKILSPKLCVETHIKIEQVPLSELKFNEFIYQIVMRRLTKAVAV